MKKSLADGPIITGLKDKIRLNGNSAAEEFIGDLKAEGSPIVEELQGDSDHTLVTFIYEESSSVCNNVLLFPKSSTELLTESYDDCLFNKIESTNLWYLTYEVENNIRLSYAYVTNDTRDDSWEVRYKKKEADRLNKCKKVFRNSQGEISSQYSYIDMPNAPKEIWAKKIPGVPCGHVEQYWFDSPGLKHKRRIHIYVPHGYSSEGEPCEYIVFNDGYEYLDVLNAIDTLNNLIASNKIPPTVAVFIESSEDRHSELKCNASFCDIICKELIPWVRDRYNISTNPKKAIIAGYSLGGLTAAYMGLHYPDVFGNVLSQSGSLWYQPPETGNVPYFCWISDEYKAASKLPLKFYLNVGILEPEYDMIAPNKAFTETLQSLGYEVTFEMFNSGHDFLYWGETLAQGLISLHKQHVNS